MSTIWIEHAEKCSQPWPVFDNGKRRGWVCPECGARARGSKSKAGAS